MQYAFLNTQTGPYFYFLCHLCLIIGNTTFNIIILIYAPPQLTFLLLNHHIKPREEENNLLQFLDSFRLYDCRFTTALCSLQRI